MKAITDIGQAVVRASGKEIFLNPSFLAMSRIGTPEQIVDAFVKVHAGHYPSTELLTSRLSRRPMPAALLKWPQLQLT
jgi:hypothetical protein